MSNPIGIRSSEEQRPTVASPSKKNWLVALAESEVSKANCLSFSAHAFLPVINEIHNIVLDLTELWQETLLKREKAAGNKIFVCPCEGISVRAIQHDLKQARKTISDLLKESEISRKEVTSLELKSASLSKQLKHATGIHQIILLKSWKQKAFQCWKSLSNSRPKINALQVACRQVRKTMQKAFQEWMQSVKDSRDCKALFEHTLHKLVFPMLLSRDETLTGCLRRVDYFRVKSSLSVWYSEMKLRHGRIIAQTRLIKSQVIAVICEMKILCQNLTSEGRFEALKFDLLDDISRACAHLHLSSDSARNRMRVLRLVPNRPIHPRLSLLEESHVQYSLTATIVYEISIHSSEPSPLEMAKAVSEQVVDEWSRLRLRGNVANRAEIHKIKKLFYKRIHRAAFFLLRCTLRNWNLQTGNMCRIRYPARHTSNLEHKSFSSRDHAVIDLNAFRALLYLSLRTKELMRKVHLLMLRSSFSEFRRVFQMLRTKRIYAYNCLSFMLYQQKDAIVVSCAFDGWRWAFVILRQEGLEHDYWVLDQQYTCALSKVEEASNAASKCSTELEKLRHDVRDHENRWTASESALLNSRKVLDDVQDKLYRTKNLVHGLTVEKARSESTLVCPHQEHLDTVPKSRFDSEISKLQLTIDTMVSNSVHDLVLGELKARNSELIHLKALIGGGIVTQQQLDKAWSENSRLSVEVEQLKAILHHTVPKHEAAAIEKEMNALSQLLDNSVSKALYETDCRSQQAEITELRRQLEGMVARSLYDELFAEHLALRGSLCSHFQTLAVRLHEIVSSTAEARADVATIATAAAAAADEWQMAAERGAILALGLSDLQEELALREADIRRMHSEVAKHATRAAESERLVAYFKAAIDAECKDELLSRRASLCDGCGAKLTTLVPAAVLRNGWEALTFSSSFGAAMNMGPLQSWQGDALDGFRSLDAGTVRPLQQPVGLGEELNEARWQITATKSAAPNAETKTERKQQLAANSLRQREDCRLMGAAFSAMRGSVLWIRWREISRQACREAFVPTASITLHGPGFVDEEGYPLVLDCRRLRRVASQVLHSWARIVDSDRAFSRGAVAAGYLPGPSIVSKAVEEVSRRRMLYEGWRADGETIAHFRVKLGLK